MYLSNCPVSLSQDHICPKHIIRSCFSLLTLCNVIVLDSFILFQGEGDGEQEHNGGYEVTPGQTALSEAQYNARLQAALAQIPRHPPPQYPGHTALPRRFSNDLPPISPIPPSVRTSSHTLPLSLPRSVDNI